MIKTEIIAYGESTFRGYNELTGVEESSPVSYFTPSMLQNHLGGGLVVDVNNVAQTGVETSVQMASGSLTTINIASHKGMLAIVNLGINDAYQGRTQTEFASNFTAAIERLRRTGKLVHIQTPNKVGVNVAYPDGTHSKNGLSFAAALNGMASQIPGIASGKGCPCQGTGSQTVELTAAAHNNDATLSTHPDHNGYATMASGLCLLVSLSTVNIVKARLAVALLYSAIFTRAVEKGGLDYWAGQITAGNVAFENGTCAAQLLPYSTYATTNDSGFVTAIYNNVFGRAPDSAGLSYWIGRLNAGDTRGLVISTMLDIGYNYTGTDTSSITSQRLIQNRASVALAYGSIYQHIAVDGTGAASVLYSVTDAYSTVSTATAGF